MRAIGQRGGLDGAVHAAGRVRRGAVDGRHWGKRQRRRLESPACVALLGGGIVAPPATGTAQSTAAARLRCSGTDPPSETVARLRGGATAPHSGGHVEVDSSEPPMGDGEFLKLRGDWRSEMTLYDNRRFGPAGWHCIPLHRPISVISSVVALYYVYSHTET
jgi:hypothetical protein